MIEYMNYLEFWIICFIMGTAILTYYCSHNIIITSIITMLPLFYFSINAVLSYYISILLMLIISVILAKKTWDMLFSRGGVSD